MRFIHLSDLHIGKRVNEFPMLEDQRYILKKIIGIIDEQKPDGIIIAGDVYDRSAPGDDAVKVFGEFLTRLAERKLQVYVISGNHDSAVKLAFASDLIEPSGIHISPVYDGEIKPYEMEKNGVKARIYMLPFIKPITVKAVFPEEADDIKSYTDACRVAIEHMQIDDSYCNILVAHQFVTGAERSESEENVGGMDNVDVSVFDCFDYVALGHLHRPQEVGRKTVRYCGTPLKYSLSEEKHKKSVTVIDITHAHNVDVSTVDLVPMHDLRRIRNTFAWMINKDHYEGTSVEDYIYAVLTDEDDIPDAMGRLRKIYPNLMKIQYDNTRTGQMQVIEKGSDLEGRTPIDLFGELYEKQNNQAMSVEQKIFLQGLIEEVWKEES